MNPAERFDPQLLETLSAYLDGRLEGSEKAALEMRLNKEESLRRQLGELRSVRDSLRALPLLKPPRSFALTPAMVGKAAGYAGIFSPLRMALGSALATLAFVCVLSVDVFSRGGFLAASTAPQALSANESFSSLSQSVDRSGAVKSAATESGRLPEATAASLQTINPTPTLWIWSPGTGGGVGTIPPPTPEPSPTTIPSPTEMPTAIPIPTVTVPPSSGGPAFNRQDFQTLAPFLEALLGFAAVLLAASAALAAILLRRRR
jgi:hypothetical protein